MACGTMRWSSPTKRYGFIQPRPVARMCLSISRQSSALVTRNEGQQIEYEIEEDCGKTSAVNLKVK